MSFSTRLARSSDGSDRASSTTLLALLDIISLHGLIKPYYAIAGKPGKHLSAELNMKIVKIHVSQFIKAKAACRS
jgi:hypothetical protein